MNIKKSVTYDQNYFLFTSDLLYGGSLILKEYYQYTRQSRETASNIAKSQIIAQKYLYNTNQNIVNRILMDIFYKIR